MKIRGVEPEIARSGRVDRREERHVAAGVIGILQATLRKGVDRLRVVDAAVRPARPDIAAPAIAEIALGAGIDAVDVALPAIATELRGLRNVRQRPARRRLVGDGGGGLDRRVQVVAERALALIEIIGADESGDRIVRPPVEPPLKAQPLTLVLVIVVEPLRRHRIARAAIGRRQRARRGVPVARAAGFDLGYIDLPLPIGR